MHSNWTVDVLRSLSVEEIAEADAETLSRLGGELSQMRDDLKRMSTVFDDAKVRRYDKAAKEAMRAAGKDTGTVHVKDGAFDVAIEVPKRVVWDQKKLHEVFSRMDDEDARHYCTAKLSVQESIYKTAPPGIRKALSAARTLFPGTMRITLERKQ